MYFYKAHPLARPVPEASGVECEVCISLSGSGQKATQREREREREKDKKQRGSHSLEGRPSSTPFTKRARQGDLSAQSSESNPMSNSVLAEALINYSEKRDISI